MSWYANDDVSNTRIRNGRFNRFLTRLFDARDDIDSVETTARPVIDVMPMDAPENYLPRGERLFCVSQSVNITGVDGNAWLGCTRPDVLTIVRRIIISCHGLAAGEKDYSIKLSRNAIPVNASDVYAIAQDLRMSSDTPGFFYKALALAGTKATSDAAIPSGSADIYSSYIDNDRADIFNTNIVLTEGHSVVVRKLSTVAGTMLVTFQGYERNIRQTELDF